MIPVSKVRSLDHQLKAVRKRQRIGDNIEILTHEKCVPRAGKCLCVHSVSPQGRWGRRAEGQSAVLHRGASHFDVGICARGRAAGLTARRCPQPQSFRCNPLARCTPRSGNFGIRFMPLRRGARPFALDPRAHAARSRPGAHGHAVGVPHPPGGVSGADPLLEGAGMDPAARRGRAQALGRQAQDVILELGAHRQTCLRRQGDDVGHVHGPAPPGAAAQGPSSTPHAIWGKARPTWRRAASARWETSWGRGKVRGCHEGRPEALSQVEPGVSGVGKSDMGMCLTQSTRGACCVGLRLFRKPVDSCASRPRQCADPCPRGFVHACNVALRGGRACGMTNHNATQCLHLKKMEAPAGAAPALPAP